MAITVTRARASPFMSAVAPSKPQSEPSQVKTCTGKPMYRLNEPASESLRTMPNSTPLTPRDLNLRPYVGGQAEIQNPIVGLLCRGQIKTAEVREEPGLPPTLYLTFDWIAQGVDYPPSPSRWIRQPSPRPYNTFLDAYTIQNIGPSPDYPGLDRLFLSSQLTDEVITLFPKGGSKLQKPPHDQTR
jgi:hypothetical protein